MLNFSLGFALAVYLERMQSLRQYAGNTATVVQPTQTKTAEDHPKEEPEPVADELPEEWAEKLEKEGIEADSFLEAVLYVLNLDVRKYRKHLISIETGIRNGQSALHVSLAKHLSCYLQMKELAAQPRLRKELGKQSRRQDSVLENKQLS
ncbi:MAG: hypothetical protein IH991_25830 [Planctomycetes bacterium]|nr:hypothetical protein [Planctomycetota bacterium]